MRGPIVTDAKPAHHRNPPVNRERLPMVAMPKPRPPPWRKQRNRTKRPRRNPLRREHPGNGAALDHHRPHRIIKHTHRNTPTHRGTERRGKSFSRAIPGKDEIFKIHALTRSGDELEHRRKRLLAVSQNRNVLHGQRRRTNQTRKLRDVCRVQQAGTIGQCGHCPAQDRETERFGQLVRPLSRFAKMPPDATVVRICQFCPPPDCLPPPSCWLRHFPPPRPSPPPAW